MEGAPSRPQRLFSPVPHPQLSSMKAVNVEQRREAQKLSCSTRLLMRKKEQTRNIFFLDPTLHTNREAKRREEGQVDFQRDFGAQ